MGEEQPSVLCSQSFEWRHEHAAGVRTWVLLACYAHAARVAWRAHPHADDTVCETTMDTRIVAHVHKSVRMPTRTHTCTHIHTYILERRAQTAFLPYACSGTTVDMFLRENMDWLSRATNWAKFSATAGLGVIHRCVVHGPACAREVLHAWA